MVVVCSQHQKVEQVQQRRLCKVMWVLVCGGLFASPTPPPSNTKGLSSANSSDPASMLAELGSPLLVGKRHDEVREREGGCCPYVPEKGHNASFLLSPVFWAFLFVCLLWVFCRVFSFSLSFSTFTLFFNIEIPCWNVLSPLVLSKHFTGISSLQEMLWARL